MLWEILCLFPLKSVCVHSVITSYGLNFTIAGGRTVADLKVKVKVLHYFKK